MSSEVIDASRVAWTVIKKSRVEEIKEQDRIVESPKPHLAFSRKLMLGRVLFTSFSSD